MSSPCSMASPALVALLALVALASALGCGREPAPAEPLRVAAAADLTVAFGELGALHQRRGGLPVSFTFAATGLLAKQIREGAPFDLFAAADVAHVDEVVAAGVCDGATKAIEARGRIVLWTSGSSAPASVQELTAARYGRIAIANPEHAPYGRAARDALEKAGVLEQLRPRLVYGENVRQTLQLAESGNVEVAIVALALVVTRGDGSHTLVPEALHRPIEQALVACRGGSRFEEARDFAALVLSAEGQAILRRHGFSLLDERQGSSR